MIESPIGDHSSPSTPDARSQLPLSSVSLVHGSLLALYGISNSLVVCHFAGPSDS